MNLKPVPHKTTWTVWTSSETYRGEFQAGHVVWSWMAQGPRGYEAGAESTADEAAHKAFAASELLRDPKEKR